MLAGRQVGLGHRGAEYLTGRPREDLTDHVHDRASDRATPEHAGEPHDADAGLDHDQCGHERERSCVRQPLGLAQSPVRVPGQGRDTNSTSQTPGAITLELEGLGYRAKNVHRTPFMIGQSCRCTAEMRTTDGVAGSQMVTSHDSRCLRRARGRVRKHPPPRRRLATPAKKVVIASHRVTPSLRVVALDARAPRAAPPVITTTVESTMSPPALPMYMGESRDSGHRDDLTDRSNPGRRRRPGTRDIRTPRQLH